MTVLVFLLLVVLIAPGIIALCFALPAAGVEYLAKKVRRNG